MSRKITPLFESASRVPLTHSRSLSHLLAHSHVCIRINGNIKGTVQHFGKLCLLASFRVLRPWHTTLTSKNCHPGRPLRHFTSLTSQKAALERTAETAADGTKGNTSLSIYTNLLWLSRIFLTPLHFLFSFLFSCTDPLTWTASHFRFYRLNQLKFCQQELSSDVPAKPKEAHQQPWQRPTTDRQAWCVRAFGWENG